MTDTFEQGWAARPFKEQFPELDDKAADRLDRLNMGITDLYMGDLLTDSQVEAIRQKKFPKLVSKAVNAARAKAEGEQP
jgi:hypothetical protein